jgi:ribosomal protein S18 acetylase RimI-like enzyme
VSFEIRPLEPADIPAVRALWASCEGLGDGPGDSPEGLTRFLARNPGLSRIAFADGGTIGAALCGHDGRRGFLYRVAVAPDQRRRGVAEGLVRSCLDGLRNEGIERSLMFVLTRNEGAQGFWKAMGGKRRGQLEIWSVDL